ncbi:TadE/TadG family type IV pilus assembly protein [Rhizobium sp. 18065]|uniref:TadE/TadG family type IV pilus assembly protein n=1 Tax=Rhizobium sp. 18065 TaxID=2681411 RepID=UPI0013572B5D|nr:TadE/TadG family type IV pilus assembly protein [Rhizobium sp. 18065]
MTKTNRQHTLLARLLRDRNGNFGMMTAIILPVALATAGVAMDLNRMVQIRAALQDSADAATLAAASALAADGITDEEAIELAKKFMAAQFSNINGESGSDIDGAEDDTVDKNAIGSVERNTTTASGKTFDVTLSGYYNMPTNGLTALLGWDKVKLNVTSTAQSTTESKNALSMFLVLDRSGSMAETTSTINAAAPTKTVSYDCGSYNKKGNWVSKTCTRQDPNYYTKIEALKLAAANLTAQLDAADTEKKYVRTAAVSYNSAMQTPTAFEWGTTTALKYVQALPASGNTDSSAAMARAYTDVTAASEITAHKNKNGQNKPGKFIVFMTDGDNNQSNADTKTKATCTAAKTDGVEIFTVAFMAPTGGQKLLRECATDTSHYYDASNAAELVAAFKEIGEKATQASTRLTN